MGRNINYKTDLGNELDYRNAHGVEVYWTDVRDAMYKALGESKYVDEANKIYIYLQCVDWLMGPGEREGVEERAMRTKVQKCRRQLVKIPIYSSFCLFDCFFNCETSLTN